MKKALETVKRKEDRKPRFERRVDRKFYRSSEKVEPKEAKPKEKEEVKEEIIETAEEIKEKYDFNNKIIFINNFIV